MTQTLIDNNELSRVVNSAGLETASAAKLLETFQPFFNQVRAIADESTKIVVTDATQLTEMKAAREARLKIKAIRTEAEKVRKVIKQDALRTGQSIDKVAGVIATMAEVEEDRLLEIEEFAIRAEAARKSALIQFRSPIVFSLGADPNLYQLGEMPEDQWRNLEAGLKAVVQQKVEAEAQAKADAEATEQKRLEEQNRLLAENARLQLEAKQREAAAKKEREKAIAERQAADEKARLEQEHRDAAHRVKDEAARKEREAIEAKARAERDKIEAAAHKAKLEYDAKLKYEREAREKIERERKAEADAAAKKAQQETAAKKKAERAPDKQKLISLSKHIAEIEIPIMTTDAGEDCIIDIKEAIFELCTLIDTKASSI